MTMLVVNSRMHPPAKSGRESFSWTVGRIIEEAALQAFSNPKLERSHEFLRRVSRGHMSA